MKKVLLTSIAIMGIAASPISHATGASTDIHDEIATSQRIGDAFRFCGDERLTGMQLGFAAWSEANFDLFPASTDIRQVNGGAVALALDANPIDACAPQARIGLTAFNPDWISGSSAIAEAIDDDKVQADHLSFQISSPIENTDGFSGSEEHTADIGNPGIVTDQAGAASLSDFGLVAPTPSGESPVDSSNVDSPLPTGTLESRQSPAHARVAALAIPNLRDNGGKQKPDASEAFGAVPIPVSHLAVDRRWRSIAPNHPTSLFGKTCVGDRALCGSPLMHAWSRLEADARSAKSEPELLRRVSVAVNDAVRYRDDMDNYGVPDYWASPEEMARRGSGDCKAIALAKMWILMALDIPSSDLRIVVVKDTRNGAGHAVLDVDLDGTNFILDNMTNEVRLDQAISWYQPLYAVGTTGSWIYGKRQVLTAANATKPRLVNAMNTKARRDNAKYDFD